MEAVTGGGAKTDWYLPSQKELMQAYIDGTYNQAGATFTATSYFWSSTEGMNSPYAWRARKTDGTALYTLKTNSYAVRCVRRD